MTLARLFQETEGQVAFFKQSSKGMARLIDLLSSTDATLCRSAAYAISNVSQYRTKKLTIEPNAISACSGGAIERLLALSNQTGKHAASFTADALQKILKFSNLKLYLRSSCEVLASESIGVGQFYRRWIL